MKDKTAFGLVAVWFVCAIIMACILFATSSCSLVMAPIPDDFPVIDTDTVPVDTILPLEDTCESYHVVTQPDFVCFFINLDLPLSDSTFYYNNTPIDPETYFTSIYYSGQNIGGIIEGTSNSTALNGKIWVRDGGAKHFLNFTSKGMYFRGALTFDQYTDELRPSVRFLNFGNTGYTCEQISQVLDYLLDDCKAAPPNSRIDLRNLQCTFSQLNDLTERGWNIWL